MSANNGAKKRSFMLGLFVVFQLIFLLGHNVLSYVQELQGEMPADAQTAVRQFAPDWPTKKGHVWTMMEGTTTVTHRWSQVTLQLQLWALFAPSIGKECVFPALLLSDDEPSDSLVTPLNPPVDYEVRGKLIRSVNEPADMHRFVRWGNFRLRRYESNVVAYLTPKTDETPDQMTERLQKRLKDFVADNSEMLGAYLRFRLKQTDEPQPIQVILLLRRFSLKAPEHGADFVDGPMTVPALRWLPHADKNPAQPTLEYFNLTTNRFEPL